MLPKEKGIADAHLEKARVKCPSFTWILDLMLSEIIHLHFSSTKATHGTIDAEREGDPQWLTRAI